MSGKRNCLDDSVMENLFGLLKTEMFYGYEFKLIKYFIYEMGRYINYYINKRIKCKLKGLSPVQYGKQSSRIV